MNRYVAVGNEPFLQTYNGSFLQTTSPALQNIQGALIKAGLSNQVKVTPPQNADVYASPSGRSSDGDFRSDIRDLMLATVKFLDDNAAPLHRSSSAVVDGSVTYSSMFDANLDALVWAMKKNGQGTPMRAGPIDAYLFSLIDEDEKSIQPGNFQRHWGIYTYDGWPKYQLNLGTTKTGALLRAKNIQYLDEKWCVLKPSVILDNSKVAPSISYACVNADYKTWCGDLDARGNISYAFNSFYQKNDQDVVACGFENLATTTNKDPPTGTCRFGVMIIADSGIRYQGAGLILILSLQSQPLELNLSDSQQKEHKQEQMGLQRTWDGSPDCFTPDVARLRKYSDIVSMSRAARQNIKHVQMGASQLMEWSPAAFTSDVIRRRKYSQ
ncbi:glucan endo-1,3-beta-glucosidase [Musa troglodytarum]|uniref:Glucan endo-1,3-beta-glucosidase n=1 Tax=Musa troglodytarum TaxID=320322 RepID=A0A9E7F9D6_9LILI|nr:glucan endo-1,3-beta-glucosidase [Musa troglodytarum]